VNYFGRSQGISLYQRCNSRYLLSVALLNYHDGADEFRIEIVGNFVGACVHEGSIAGGVWRCQNLLREH